MDASTFNFDMATAIPVGENRQQDRVPVAMPARLRDRASNKFEVRLLDLSVSGFRAEAHYSLDKGMIVWLTIPGMQGLEATVAWRHRDVIGCHFHQPLYPAVFEHVIRTLNR